MSPMNVITPAALLAMAAAIIGTPSALGADPRDVVFECPCQAEWVPTGSGDSGELTLHFGVRSFRATESAEVRLSLAADLRGSRSVTGNVSWRELPSASWLSVGSVGPEAVLPGQHRTFTLSRPGRTIQSCSYSTSGPQPYRRERAGPTRSTRGSGTRR